MSTPLELLMSNNEIREIDRYFAEFIDRIAKNSSKHLTMAAALVSNASGHGDVCIDLNDHASQWDIDIDEWRDALVNSGVVAESGTDSPLILDKYNRLYLQRYWYHEQRVIEQLKKRATESVGNVDLTKAATILKELFSDSLQSEQAVAVATSLINPLTIITGGPGTGKTYTVLRLMTLLQQIEDREPYRIAIAAPTGKATARLSESINHGSDDLKQHFALSLEHVEITTIHRLLKPHPSGSGFRFNRDNQLHLDLLIIDEASMIDLPLMSHLLAAIPDHTRVVFLGDHNQLASVEAGSVLGDLCGGYDENRFSNQQLETLSLLGISEHNNPVNEAQTLDNHIVHFNKSYRFSEESGIAALASGLKIGDSETVLKVLSDRERQVVRWYDSSTVDVIDTISSLAVEHYQHYIRETEPEKVLKAFGAFQVLAATVAHQYGVDNLNLKIEQALVNSGLIKRDDRFYLYRPVMITRNDYHHQLFNGDIGIILPDPEDPTRRRAWFMNESGELRSILPSRLPECKTVYAMTIHKSQGSEFDRVCVVLPDLEMPILTRELLYTAVTRARVSVDLFTTEDVLTKTVAAEVRRVSGLKEALWCGMD